MMLTKYIIFRIMLFYYISKYVILFSDSVKFDIHNLERGKRMNSVNFVV